MTRFASSAGPRLFALSLLLGAIPGVAADTPGDPAVPVSAVPAYAAPPPYAVPPPGYGPPGYAPVAAPAEDAAPAPVGIARRVQVDPVAERSYFAPTALVAPAGTTTFTLQAPLAPGAALRVDRSFGDRLSLGVGVVGVLDDQDLYGIGNLHAKYQLVRGRRLALAVTASMYNFPEELDSDAGSQNLFMPGAVASLCTGDDCRTLISLDVQALTGVSEDTLPIVGGVSLATGVRRQLIAEVHTTTADEERVWFGFVGGRFLTRRFAIDAGFGFGAVREQGVVIDCVGEPEGSCPPEEWSTGAYPFLALSSRL